MNSSLPNHVAIIMDGNGRWAARRHQPRIFGHIKGCSQVREIVRASRKIGIQALTLFAFSSENWGRPSDEVSLLMRLLKKWLMRRAGELMENDIRFQAIGDLEKLPMEVLAVVREKEELTRANKSMVLTVALSYSGQQEILKATKEIALEVAQGKTKIQDINVSKFESKLSTFNIGNVDFLIRTSGELRISNFLLWQVAYAELYFTELMWPEFEVENFHEALTEYSRRQRRFGLIPVPLNSRTILR